MLLEIGHRIAHVRKERGLTQKALASLSGLSRATVDALENGRIRELGISKIERILLVLGLELGIRPAKTRPNLVELLQEQDKARSL